MVLKIVFRLLSLTEKGVQKIRYHYFKSVYGTRWGLSPKVSLGQGWNIHLMSPTAHIRSGEGTQCGDFLLVNNAGNLDLGSHTTLGRLCTFNLAPSSSLTFGTRNLIEESCAFELKSSASTVRLGDRVHMKRGCTVMSMGGNIEIGEDVFFNSFCSLNALENIQIGENTLLGEGVKLYDHNHVYADPSVPISEQGYTTGPISIGKNCWIGSNVVILKNVSIGDHCVIGANNLIFKSIPAHTVVKSNTTFNN